MLSFRDVLTSEGIEASKVRLVRHQARGPTGLTPWALWRASDGRFELYQSIQKQPVFGDASTIATFVVPPEGSTVFAGLYVVGRMGRSPNGVTCPIMLHDVSGLILYDLAPNEKLSNYRGRLHIDWGAGYIKWVQRADRKEKPITRLTKEIVDPPFPGFLEFRWVIAELEGLPETWRATLCAVRGIYILTCPSTGVQYVGSASGDQGFLGRWRDYLADGHGGTVSLKGTDARAFQVAILETAPTSMTREEILARESMWKAKLGSRVFGLNAS